MKTNIGENIKFYRKEKGFTQEQLAEAMRVSVGAVSKWECDLSIPEIGIIMELADFFEISVDTLLGYKMHSNAADETAKRIHRFYIDKDYRNGIFEVEKAVQKYPNNFAIIYRSAIFLFMYALEENNKELMLHSKELFEHALVIYDPNQNFCNGKTDIYESLSEIYFFLDKPEKAVEILKQHNEMGVFSYRIGETYATTFNNPEDAFPYLSDALVKNLAYFFEIAIGFANAYEKTKKENQHLGFDILSAVAEFYEKFHIEGTSSFLDKSSSLLYFGCAQYYENLNDEENAKIYLIMAKETAERFDKSPDNTARNIKFYKKEIPAVASSSVTGNAVDILKNMIDPNKNLILTKIWNEIVNM